MYNLDFVIDDCTVDILLATCNGENYIQTLLESLLSQSINQWNLIVRDDSSTDSTLELIRTFKLHNQAVQNIQILSSDKREGINENFSRLLYQSNSEYIMFADQDDYWLPQKIDITLKKMVELELIYGKNTPLLVHTDLTVVNSDLEVISNSFAKFQNIPHQNVTSLSRLLVHNTVTGCTMMINSSLKKLIDLIPLEAVMYDWWIALVAKSFGRIAYIPCSTILYRQHLYNNIGARKWGGTYIVNRIKNIDSVLGYYLKTIQQAEAFINIYQKQLDKPKYEIIFNYVDLRNKSFFFKRVNLIKYGYYQLCSLRNLGLFIVV
jgi:glycosyltransferase involved in cell wall biosynthesis